MIVSDKSGKDKRASGVEKICFKLSNLDFNEVSIREMKLKLDQKKFNGRDLSLDVVEALKDSIKIDMSNLTGRRVVLVGPPGVGKTTTIAKIAANLLFNDHKKVGLITTDTYRIGAVEQLKIYAEIMNMPFRGVITQEEMDEALEHMKDCDTILIDTTGRSYTNSKKILELKEYIEKVGDKKVLLVLSCTTNDRCVKSTIDAYRPLNFTSLVISKLDETTTYGSIMNILNHSKKPISYLTTGQNVPEDILKPDKDKIIRLFLGAECI
jgi:flagellar biosynthesis protein FlhF